MTYPEFLESKRIVAPMAGSDVPPEAIHPALYDFQRDIVRWALRPGRAAIFEDCGLGKTSQQLEWARHAFTAWHVLIVAPLSVAQQTIQESARPNLRVANVDEPDDFQPSQLT